ncbi:MAG TPA: chaperone modulator CbpM [Chryseolinea sp.]
MKLIIKKPAGMELIESIIGREKFLPVSELEDLEKIVHRHMLHLHFEMDINLEDIEAISHLFERMNRMQQQINQLTHWLKARDSAKYTLK